MITSGTEGLIMGICTIRSAFVALGLTFAAIPALADTLEELDALSDSSVDEAAGITLARDQAARGEYLEALATLERVMAVHPKSREARLIHAIFLCRVDDQQGGLVEIGQLKEKHYGKEVLKQARDACKQGASS